MRDVFSIGIYRNGVASECATNGLPTVGVCLASCCGEYRQLPTLKRVARCVPANLDLDQLHSKG